MHANLCPPTPDIFLHLWCYVYLSFEGGWECGGSQLLMQEESSTIRLHDENMSPGASWYVQKVRCTYLIVSLERVGDRVYRSREEHLVGCILHQGLVQSPCGKINIIMMLTFYPPPPPSLNVTAFQHRFNTESLILFHLAYTFGIYLHCILQCQLCLQGFIAYLCFSCYVVLDPAVKF